MSRRTFARRFKAETGSTPTNGCSSMRTAQSLLETTDQPIEQIAQVTGFGNAAAMRPLRATAPDDSDRLQAPFHHPSQ